MSLRGGFAISDIHAPPGLAMGGYAARSGVAEGTLDSLCCRVCVLSDAHGTLALVVLDLLFVSGVWTDELRTQIGARLGCDAAGVLIAATHTHAGPALFGTAPSTSAGLRDFERELATTVLQTVADARARQQEVHLALGEAHTAAVAANRRDVVDSVDDTVRVLVARATSGGYLGALGVFACHPTVLPPSNCSYSRDFFGYAVDAASETLGAPVLLFNGAAADVSTRFTRRAADRAEAARLGQIVGDAIAAGAASAKPIKGTPLSACIEPVPIVLRELPSPTQAQDLVARAAEELQKMQTLHTPAAEQRHAAAQLEGAVAQLFLATHGGAAAWLGHTPETATTQLLRIGDCDMVGAPGELLSRVGCAIAQARSRRTLVVGYANDYLGYFVDPPAASAGGYEALTAVVDPVSADRLAHRLAALDCRS